MQTEKVEWFPNAYYKLPEGPTASKIVLPRPPPYYYQPSSRTDFDAYPHFRPNPQQQYYNNPQIVHQQFRPQDSLQQYDPQHPHQQRDQHNPLPSHFDESNFQRDRQQTLSLQNYPQGSIFPVADDADEEASNKDKLEQQDRAIYYKRNGTKLFTKTEKILKLQYYAMYLSGSNNQCIEYAPKKLKVRPI